MTRTIACGLIAAYLMMGLCIAAALKTYIPPLNWLGTTYITFTWPSVPFCELTTICNGMPPEWITNHFFTFKATK